MNDEKTFKYTLANLSIGDFCVVRGFKDVDRSLRKKLLSMGVTPKITIEVVRVAPLGDPIEIKVRGFSLTLRKNEAEHIIISKI